MNNIVNKKNNINKSFFLILLFLFFKTSLFCLNVNEDSVVSSDEYLLSIINMIIKGFEQPLFKGICCLCLIGESIAIIWAGGNNNTSIIKRLIPIVVGTILFLLAAKITNIMFTKEHNILGINRLPTFNRFVPGSELSNAEELKGISLLNLPIVLAFQSFTTILFNVRDIVLLFTILFCFLNIIFNAFKLWMGTIELKKLYVDLVYKFTLVLILCFIYPTVQQKTIQLGFSIGMSSAGGYEHLSTQFTTSFNNISKKYVKHSSKIYETLKTHQSFTSEDGKSYLTEKDIMQAKKSMNMTDEEIKDYMIKNNMVLVTQTGWEKFVGAFKSKNINFQYTDENGNIQTVKMDRTYAPTINDTLTQYYSDGNGGYYENKNYDKELDDAVKLASSERNKLESLLEVISGISLDDAIVKQGLSLSDVEKIIENDLGNTWLNPFFVSDNNNATFILAPASLLKMINLYTEVISETQGKNINNEDPVSGSEFKLTSIWTSIKAFILKIMFYIGSYIAEIYIMATYTMAVIEYLIVTSLATLLIPFFFIDSIKSYAQNIIGLLIKYFFKFVVIGITTFWSLSMFMNTLENTFALTDLNNIWTFLNLFFTLAIVVSLVTMSEKITNTLISGNPSLGTGDLHHLAHDAAVMGHNAEKVGKDVGKLAGNLGHFGQKGINKGIETFNNFRGGQQGHKEMLQERAKDIEAQMKKGTYTSNKKKNAQPVEYSEMTQEQRQKAAMKEAKRKLGTTAGAGFAAVGGQMKQNMGDKAYKALTGKDRQHLDENGNTNGRLKLGDEYIKDGRRKIAESKDIQEQSGFLHKTKA